MKILILDTYYEAFLKDFYSKDPELPSLPFEQQRAALLFASFGNSDFYSRNLSALGNEAEVIVVNCRPLQRRWAKENGSKLPSRRLFTEKDREMAIVDAQVRRFRPEVIYVHNVAHFPADFIRHIGSHARIVVGQNACPLDWTYDFGCYDLIVTSFPHYVNKFRTAGVQSAYLPLGFDPVVFDRLKSRKPEDKKQAVFVGGLSAYHQSGVHLLEKISSEFPIEIWGHGADQWATSSPLRQHYRGEAWGLEMFGILAAAQVSLNRHIDVAEDFANNMRLFETTGVGSCLLTDLKDNLHDFFRLDQEVVAYTSAEDCTEKIHYLLENEKERATIAKAGQIRTLKEHTYAQRMEDLSEILEKQLSSKRVAGTQRRVPEPWKPRPPTFRQGCRRLVRRSPIGPLAHWAWRRIKDARPSPSEPRRRAGLK